MRLLVVTAVAAERDSVLAGSRARFPGEPVSEPLPGRRSLLVLRGGRHRVDLLAAGVGPAAAAAGAAAALTAAELSGRPYDLVVASGIAGGFLPSAPPGSVVVADEIVAADLGAEAPAPSNDSPRPPSARQAQDTRGARNARETREAQDARDAGAAPDDAPDAPGPGADAPEAAPVAPEAAPDLPGRPPAGPSPADSSPTGFIPVVELGFGTSSHVPPPALRAAVAEALGAVCGPVLTVSTVTGSARRAAELAARHPGAAAEAMEGFGVAEAAAAHGVPVLELRTVSNPVGPRNRAAWRIGDALAALSSAFEGLMALLDTLDTVPDTLDAREAPTP